MNLYCDREGKKERDVNDVCTTSFGYMEVAMFLQNHPKFRSRSSDDEVKMVDNAIGNGVR